MHRIIGDTIIEKSDADFEITLFIIFKETNRVKTLKKDGKE